MEDESAVDILSPHLLKIALDPVFFCKTFLVNPKTSRPIVPYPYQAEILNHKSIRKVLRLGRRCGKTQTMIIHMIWQCSIRKYLKCLVVTPYERQIQEIFDTMLAILDASPFFKNSYKSTKHPFQIKFNNGAIINLMTAGTKSGSEGAGSRGQDADWIYFDEMDYLDDADISTVVSIQLRGPMNTGIWGASTPTGRRATFYKYCTDKRTGYTEFHYTFFDSPVWANSTEEEKLKIEQELRAQYPDDISYQHEVLADFGTEAVGVFLKENIDRARSYSFEEVGDKVNILWDYFQERDRKGFLTNTLIRPPYKAIRAVGVDWDKKGAPTEIIVSEWCHWIENPRTKHKGMFRVIARIEIPRSEFTLSAAVNKIIEINEIYDPDFIYVDQGYGEMQVEQLRLYGMSHPESGLHKKVKPIAFGSKIDVRDPYTGEISPKHAKPFLVNNAVHILDSDLIQINDQDELLWRQMQNYQITGVSIYGLPKYSDKDEHALDALMLSLLAMTMEFPELSKLISKFRPSFKVEAVKRKENFNSKILAPLDSKKVDDDDDPIEAKYAKYKNCRNISWGKNSVQPWESRGERSKPPKRRSW